jgi:hypothetical protein
MQQHQHKYLFVVHSGDGFGLGCVSSVSFEVLGTHGRLLSSQCVLKEIQALTTKRPHAIHFAAQKKDAPVSDVLSQR